MTTADVAASLKFSYADEEIDLDEQLEQEVRQATIGPNFYTKKDDEQVVRFVAWKNGVTLFKHEKYERGKDGNGQYVVSTICPRHVGKECPWCEMGDDAAMRQGVMKKKLFGQQVFNVTGNRTQLFMFPVNKTTPMETLAAIAKNRRAKTKGNGSIEDMDITIKQSGEGKSRSFVCTPDMPSPSEYHGDIWSKDLLVEKIITKVSPELIGKQRGDSGLETSGELDTDALTSDLDI